MSALLFLHSLIGSFILGEMKQLIHFFYQNIDFELGSEHSTRKWILDIIKANNRVVEGINYIFCSDPYLLALNQKYLQHDEHTDILTFPYHSSDSSPLLSDIYISIDRVKDNALHFHVPFEEELQRVIIHGVLHLLGFDDHSGKGKLEMRRQEDLALNQRK